MFRPILARLCWAAGGLSFIAASVGLALALTLALCDLLFGGDVVPALRGVAYATLAAYVLAVLLLMVAGGLDS